MELRKLLRTVEMFSGLSDNQIEKLAGSFEEQEYKRDEILFSQGQQGDRLYLIRDGFVEVLVDSGDASNSKAILNLGPGQSVGEMSLIDTGLRSATCRAASDNTLVASITRDAFERLCESDPALGYRIMRNIAADLSFRLRRRTMADL